MADDLFRAAFGPTGELPPFDEFDATARFGATAPFDAGAPLTASLGLATSPTESTWSAWRAELAELGGANPLLHFDDAPSTRIELSTTHPGGIAKFIAGQRTLLSSLIRDDLALRAARKAAATLCDKAIELAATRGIDSVHLAVGLAEWTHDGIDYRAPVLLQPLTLRRYGRDFEVRLTGGPALNPALARALSEQFQIVLDAGSFVDLAHLSGTFKPQPVIDRLRGLTAHLPWFNVQPRLIVSSFAEIPPSFSAELGGVAHPVLDALAGSSAARAQLRERYRRVEHADSDHRAPGTDTLLLDADAEQERIIAEIAAGASLTVATVPGSGGTQTLVNTIGALVAQGKRVLVVSPRRASLRSVATRLADIRLPGLAVSPSSLAKDLIRAISRNEKAERPQVAEIDEALIRLRTVLLDYRQALVSPHPELGITVLEALDELARLALLPEQPATTSRLSRHAVIALRSGRADAAATLVEAAQLGEFETGPDDSPWYGIDFATAEDAAAAHDLARELHRELLPDLVSRMSQTIAPLPIQQPRTVAELGDCLALLVGIRETLDRFLPEVFDRSLAELIIATGPRRDTALMSNGDRRRLKRLAREYVRPGAPVQDLHGSLVAIQHQRTMWQRIAVNGVAPTVPIGLTDLSRAQHTVMHALEALDVHLNPDGARPALRDLPLSELTQRMERLAADSAAMDNVHERTGLLRTLRDLDLSPLLRDLAERHVPGDRVALELELSWWQSALELMLRENRALLGANTEVITRLEADYRLVDDAHAAANASLLAWQLAQSWRIGIVDNPGEADSLRQALKTGDLDAAALQRLAPSLGRILAPVWMCSPYEVGTLPNSIAFDAVLLVDAAAITVAEAVPAIRRGRQLAAFGDAVTQHPAPFEIGLHEGHRASSASEPPRSAFDGLRELLPNFALTRSYRSGGQDLTDLNSRQFYDGGIDSLPWAGQYLGHSSVSVDIVDGAGMPDPVTGSVESVDAEVERVVELVEQHAVRADAPSLMVLTASATHAARVEQAVNDRLAKRPELGEFLLADSAEPFMVATLEQAVGQSRDRVIFSIGYGRTPHGRLLSNFGPLAEPGGERALAHAMTRARKSLAIVAAFTADEIDDDRMRYGMIPLAHVLRDAANPEVDAPPVDDRDPMLVDLARRLEQRGLRVTLGYRDRLRLVASYGGRAAVIETDAVLGRLTLRESLRLRPQTLHRLGWHYLRVHAFALFADPDAVASRIARTLGAAPEQLETAPPPVAAAAHA